MMKKMMIMMTKKKKKKKMVKMKKKKMMMMKMEKIDLNRPIKSDFKKKKKKKKKKKHTNRISGKFYMKTHYKKNIHVSFGQNNLSQVINHLIN